MIRRIIETLSLGLIFFISSSCINVTRTTISSYGDGPYILDNEDSNLIISRTSDGVFDSVYIKKTDIAEINFKCEFDSISCPSLLFNIHSNNSDNSDTFSMPDKLLALSDIEGNFEKYYSLLFANNVIDTNYNWTFGKGYLVIVGDLVDRGEYVTQCLWLTYHLENESVKHGGKVHYLLGNHEQIVLMGYDNYCAPKYHMILETLQTDISHLYSKNSELGKWLRSKNSMVKIGDFIFVHGGISPSLMQYDLSIQKINSEIKRDIDTQDFKTDESLALLTEEGILWYRGLIEDGEEYKKISENELDKVLNLYNCKSIVIGHTPIDSISKDFNGKVIRLDVDHYENSSALYIENGLQYIVDNEGQKIIF